MSRQIIQNKRKNNAVPASSSSSSKRSAPLSLNSSSAASSRAPPLPPKISGAIQGAQHFLARPREFKEFIEEFEEGIHDAAKSETKADEFLRVFKLNPEVSAAFYTYVKTTLNVVSKADGPTRTAAAELFADGSLGSPTGPANLAKMLYKASGSQAQLAVLQATQQQDTQLMIIRSHVLVSGQVAKLVGGGLPSGSATVSSGLSAASSQIPFKDTTMHKECLDNMLDFMHKDLLVVSENNAHEFSVRVRNCDWFAPGIEQNIIAARFSAATDDPPTLMQKIGKRRFNTLKETVFKVLFGCNDIKDKTPRFVGSDNQPFFISSGSEENKEWGRRLVGKTATEEEEEEEVDEDNEAKTKEESAVAVFELALTILVFYSKYMLENKTIVITDELAAELHAMSNSAKVAFLGVQFGPNTVVLVVHFLMSWLGCYVSGQTTVTMAGAEAGRRIAELKLTALVLSQDNNSSHYTETGGDGCGYEYDPVSATSTMRIPGIAMNQLDSRNQMLLKGACSVLAGVSGHGKAQHDSTLTAGGSYGSKEGAFFATPVFLGGWP